MASIIKLKRSGTPGGVPSGGQLQAGELAINLADKKLFSSSNGTDIFTLSGDLYNLPLTGNASQAVVTLTVDNASLSNDSITIVGDNGTVVAATNASHITIDSTTYAVSTSGNSSVGQIVLTPTGGGDASSDTLSIVGANGVVVSGNSTQITVTAESFDYDLSAGGSATTGTVVLGDAAGDDADLDTVTFSGANNVVVKNVDASNIEVYLANDVSTATVTTTGDITAQADVDVTGEANTSTLRVRSTSDFEGDVTADTKITVGNSTVNAVVWANGNVDTDGSLTVAGVTALNDTTNSTSNTTGALVVAGGAGFGKSVTIGESLTVYGDFTVQGTTTTVNSSTVSIDDAALKLADNQGDTTTFTDTADFGIYGEWGNTSDLHYSGIFRDASANVFVVINDIATEPGATVTYTSANSSSSGDLGQLDAIIDGGSY